jgi:hypothetical protein
MSSRWLISVFGILLGFLMLLPGCGTEPSFTRGMASDLVGSYTAAVAKGDSTGVLRFWSKKSQARKGFWMMPVAIGAFMEFSEFTEWVQDYAYEITNVAPCEDYHIIYFDWIPKELPVDSAQLPMQKMKYYVIFEEGRPVLANPLDVLTKDWQIHESDCFVFHYPEPVVAEDCLWEMQIMDAEARKLVRFLGAKLSDKMDFYRPVSAIVCGDLLYYPPSYAYASTDHNSIISIDFVNPHELIHMLTMSDVDFASAAFSEGVAVALGGGAWYTADFSMSQAKNLLGHPLYVPLRDMLLADNRAFLSRANVTYHESGAFVKFLLDQYGMDKLLVLQKEADSLHHLPEAIRRIYGREIEELEKDWHYYLRNLNTPEIGCTVPADAKVIFSMADKAGDDVGDGNYTYPTDERFVPGMFDLINFEMLKDEANVYFRLRFRDLANPVIDSSSNMTYTTGAVIAIKRGNEFSGRLQKNCHGVVLEDDKGYDLRLDVGRAVCLANNLGKAFFSTPDISDSVIIGEDNVIQFSVPLSVTGVPESNWEFLVGVYLMNDYGLGFLRGGPEPVHIRPGEFAFGGGKDTEYSPRFIDILLPEGVNQTKLLGSYDVKSRRRAVLPMIGVKR